MWWFEQWLSKHQERRSTRKAAWRDANNIGPDEFSNFQRQAIAALEIVTGSLPLTRAGTEMSYLWGPVPNSNLVIYIYGDEAQVHGDRIKFMRERWDYDSPEDYIRDLVKFISERLPPYSLPQHTQE